MAWPDNTPIIDNTEFLNDTGTVTGGSGAREELVTLIARLNQALDSIGDGETPWTDGNDSALMKTLAAGLDNDIGLVDASGNPLRSGKTIATTVNNNNTTVPTGLAVQTYVAANAPTPFQVKGTCSSAGSIFEGIGIASVSLNANASQSYAIWTVTFNVTFTNNDFVVFLTGEDFFGQSLVLASATTTGIVVHDYDISEEGGFSPSGSSNTCSRIHIGISGTLV